MVAPGKAAKPGHGGLSYAEAASRQAQGQPPPTRNSWAALAEEDDEGDAAGDLGDSDALEDNGGDWCDEEEGDDRADDAVPAGGQGPTEEDLKQEWVASCHSCRLLERDARTPNRLVAEARAQRDEAEKRWRAAKTPHPLYKRMRWAESDLNEAMAKEEAHRRELQAHLESSARRTAQLQQRQAADEARVARKREALAALLRESAGTPRPLPAAERAASIAAKRISTDVAPSLAAAIERLGAPLGGGDDVEGVRQELQTVAVSLARLEEVLRDGNAASAAEAMAATAQHYNIGDHHGGTSTQGASSSDGAGKPAAATGNTRWTRSSANGPWRRNDDDDDGLAAAAPGSAAAAAAAARVALRRRLDGGHDSGMATAAATAGGAGAGSSGGAQAAVDPQLPLPAAATNDLAEAERRAHQAAQHQLAESQRCQQRQLDEQQRQRDDAERQRREQLQNDEMRRHQQAVQQAAERQAAEEARQRSELLASMSPEELARAAELHAVQQAIGAQVFGTASATQAVGMAQLHEAQRAARDAEAQQEADRLMGLSPQELAAEQGASW